MLAGGKGLTILKPTAVVHSVSQGKIFERNREGKREEKCAVFGEAAGKGSVVTFEMDYIGCLINHISDVYRNTVSGEIILS